MSRPLALPSLATRLAAALLALAAAAAQAATVHVAVQDAQGRPLADAAVFIEGRELRAPARPAQAEMQQKAKVFDPMVLVVPVGTPVAFPNNDTVRHHVYSFSPTKTFELKLYTGVPANPVLFDRPGVAVLGCNIHDAMIAWVVVVDTPHFARTGPSGSVTLPQVPAGQFQLRVWHPSLPVGAPAAQQAITVGSGDLHLTHRLAGARP